MVIFFMIVLYKFQPAYEQKRGLNLFSATKTFGAFFFTKLASNFYKLSWSTRVTYVNGFGLIETGKNLQKPIPFLNFVAQLDELLLKLQYSFGLFFPTL